MKVAIYRKNGNPADVIELVEEKKEEPNSNQVIIAVEATPIHLGDLYNMEGLEGFKFSLPMVPGIEGVGRIIKLGKSVKNFKENDRVLFLSSAHVEGYTSNQQGTWRDQIKLPSDILIPCPDGDAAQFANIINPATAYVFIYDLIKPKKNEWIIQNAANSNVGRYIIKVANRYGCKTINVVRRKELVDELKKLGGDAVVLDGDDLYQKVNKATNGGKIRFALDALAGDAPARLARCLENGGTVFNYGLVSKSPCKMPTWLMLNRDIRLQGFFAGNQLMEKTFEEKKSLIKELGEIIGKGAMPSKIAKTYPLTRIKDAIIHATDSGYGRDGKIILLPNT